MIASSVTFCVTAVAYTISLKISESRATIQLCGFLLVIAMGQRSR
jgi:hypothetical protein